MSIVISIENLWKKYRLGVIGHGTLTQDLQSWWAKKCGNEDPNSKIFQKSHGQQTHIAGDNFWALQGIDMEVKHGEALGIIGKNGAGKSTLLKILSRVTAPTKGNIKIRGRIASLLEVGTGFHLELTGRENVFLNGIILGMSKQEVQLKFDEIVDFSGVESFIDTPVKRYSSGMTVRLAFAVAAHLEPEILIVDEVLAVGDADFQKKCLCKMDQVAHEGRTVLFVSHNLGSIQEFCSRAIYLLEGKIHSEGAPVSVIRDYLGANKKNQTRYEAQNERRGPCIQRVSIYQEGSEETVFSMHLPVIIDFTVDAQGKKNLVLGLVIHNETGVVIHHSSDEFADSFTGTTSSQRQCILPPYALAEGSYSLDMSFSERNVEVFEHLIGVLTFKVRFSGIMSDRETGQWIGLCGPGLLKWQHSLN